PCRDADDLVDGAVAGLLDPGDPGPPRAIALVPFPAQQMADGAAGHAGHRRAIGRLRRHLPRLEHKFDSRTAVRHAGQTFPSAGMAKWCSRGNEMHNRAAASSWMLRGTPIE